MFWKAQTHIFVVQGIFIFRYLIWPVLRSLVDWAVYKLVRSFPDEAQRQEETARAHAREAFRGKWREYEERLQRERARGGRTGPRTQSTSRPLTEREKHLQTLGLGPKADPRAIRKAYRGLAKKFHPDRFASEKHSDKKRAEASVRMRQINEAYDWLEEYPAV